MKLFYKTFTCTLFLILLISSCIEKAIIKNELSENYLPQPDKQYYLYNIYHKKCLGINSRKQMGLVQCQSNNSKDEPILFNENKKGNLLNQYIQKYCKNQLKNKSKLIQNTNNSIKKTIICPSLLHKIYQQMHEVEQKIVQSMIKDYLTKDQFFINDLWILTKDRLLEPKFFLESDNDAKPCLNSLGITLELKLNCKKNSNKNRWATLSKNQVNKTGNHNVKSNRVSKFLKIKNKNGLCLNNVRLILNKLSWKNCTDSIDNLWYYSESRQITTISRPVKCLGYNKVDKVFKGVRCNGNSKETKWKIHSDYFGSLQNDTLSFFESTTNTLNSFANRNNSRIGQFGGSNSYNSYSVFKSIIIEEVPQDIAYKLQKFSFHISETESKKILKGFKDHSGQEYFRKLPSKQKFARLYLFGIGVTGTIKLKVKSIEKKFRRLDSKGNVYIDPNFVKGKKSDIEINEVIHENKNKVYDLIIPEDSELRDGSIINIILEASADIDNQSLIYSEEIPLNFDFKITERKIEKKQKKVSTKKTRTYYDENKILLFEKRLAWSMANVNSTPQIIWGSPYEFTRKNPGLHRIEAGTVALDVADNPRLRKYNLSAGDYVIYHQKYRKKNGRLSYYELSGSEKEKAKFFDSKFFTKEEYLEISFLTVEELNRFYPLLPYSPPLHGAIPENIYNESLVRFVKEYTPIHGSTNEFYYLEFMKNEDEAFRLSLELQRYVNSSGVAKSVAESFGHFLDYKTNSNLTFNYNSTCNSLDVFFWALKHGMIQPYNFGLYYPNINGKKIPASACSHGTYSKYELLVKNQKIKIPKMKIGVIQLASLVFSPFGGGEESIEFGEEPLETGVETESPQEGMMAQIHDVEAPPRKGVVVKYPNNKNYEIKALRRGKVYGQEVKEIEGGQPNVKHFTSVSDNLIEIGEHSSFREIPFNDYSFKTLKSNIIDIQELEKEIHEGEFLLEDKNTEIAPIESVHYLDLSEQTFEKPIDQGLVHWSRDVDFSNYSGTTPLGGIDHSEQTFGKSVFSNDISNISFPDNGNNVIEIPTIDRSLVHWSSDGDFSNYLGTTPLSGIDHPVLKLSSGEIIPVKIAGDRIVPAINNNPGYMIVSQDKVLKLIKLKLIGGLGEDGLNNSLFFKKNNGLYGRFIEDNRSLVTKLKMKIASLPEIRFVKNSTVSLGQKIYDELRNVFNKNMENEEIEVSSLESEQLLYIKTKTTLNELLIQRNSIINRLANYFGYDESLSEINHSPRSSIALNFRENLLDLLEIDNLENTGGATAINSVDGELIKKINHICNRLDEVFEQENIHESDVLEATQPLYRLKSRLSRYKESINSLQQSIQNFERNQVQQIEDTATIFSPSLDDVRVWDEKLKIINDIIKKDPLIEDGFFNQEHVLKYNEVLDAGKEIFEALDGKSAIYGYGKTDLISEFTNEISSLSDQESITINYKYQGSVGITVSSFKNNYLQIPENANLDLFTGGSPIEQKLLYAFYPFGGFARAFKGTISLTKKTNEYFVSITGKGINSTQFGIGLFPWQNLYNYGIGEQSSFNLGFGINPNLGLSGDIGSNTTVSFRFPESKLKNFIQVLSSKNSKLENLSNFAKDFIISGQSSEINFSLNSINFPIGAANITHGNFAAILSILPGLHGSVGYNMSLMNLGGSNIMPILDSSQPGIIGWKNSNVYLGLNKSFAVNNFLRPINNNNELWGTNKLISLSWENQIRFAHLKNWVSINSYERNQINFINRFRKALSEQNMLIQLDSQLQQFEFSWVSNTYANNSINPFKNSRVFVEDLLSENPRIKSFFSRQDLIALNERFNQMENPENMNSVFALNNEATQKLYSLLEQKSQSSISSAQYKKYFFDILMNPDNWYVKTINVVENLTGTHSNSRNLLFYSWDSSLDFSKTKLAHSITAIDPNIGQGLYVEEGRVINDAFFNESDYLSIPIRLRDIVNEGKTFVLY